MITLWTLIMMFTMKMTCLLTKCMVCRSSNAMGKNPQSFLWGWCFARLGCCKKFLQWWQSERERFNDNETSNEGSVTMEMDQFFFWSIFSPSWWPLSAQFFLFMSQEKKRNSLVSFTNPLPGKQVTRISHSCWLGLVGCQVGDILTYATMTMFGRDSIKACLSAGRWRIGEA